MDAPRKVKITQQETGLRVLTVHAQGEQKTGDDASGKTSSSSQVNGEKKKMSENLGKDILKLFNDVLKKVKDHKVEGHGFRVKVALASYGEIEFETTPPTIIAGGGGGGRPRREPKKVTREMVETALRPFEGYPVRIEDTPTHIKVHPTGFLGEKYKPLQEAFIKMCGSHEPWHKDTENGGRGSHWAFPKEGV